MDKEHGKGKKEEKVKEKKHRKRKEGIKTLKKRKHNAQRFCPRWKLTGFGANNNINRMRHMRKIGERRKLRRMWNVGVPKM